MTCEGKKLLCYSFPYVMWTVLCLFVFWSYCADCTVLPAAAATKEEPACWQADDSVFPQNPSKHELRITTAASTPSIHTQTRLHTETHRYTWTHLRRSSRTDKHRGDTGTIPVIAPTGTHRAIWSSSLQELMLGLFTTLPQMIWSSLSDRLALHSLPENLLWNCRGI